MKDWIKKHRKITIVVMIVFIMALFITNICLACIYQIAERMFLRPLVDG